MDKECIKLDVNEYKKLIEASTRLNIIVEKLKSEIDGYFTDQKKQLLMIAGESDFVREYEEKEQTEE